MSSKFAGTWGYGDDDDDGDDSSLVVYIITYP